MSTLQTALFIWTVAGVIVIALALSPKVPNGRPTLWMLWAAGPLGWLIIGCEALAHVLVSNEPRPLAHRGNW